MCDWMKKITWYDAISGKRDVCACPFACNVVADSCMDEFHKSCDILCCNMNIRGNIFPWCNAEFIGLNCSSAAIFDHISIWFDGAFRSTLFVHSIYIGTVRLLWNQKHKHGTIRPINSPGFSMSRSLEEALYYWDGCLILNCKGTGNHGNQMAIVICDLLNKTYHIVTMVTWVRMVCECYF